jgi:hypothetical protein
MNFNPRGVQLSNLSLSHLEILGTRRLVSSFARSAASHPIVCEMTRGLANRAILWALDRKPGLADLGVAGLTAGLATDLFVARAA